MVVADVTYPLSLSLSKTGDARYLGHLDFLRLVERSLRRSRLPVRYSEGFNPRIKMSFSDALPVGTASQGEWLTIILTKDLATDAVRARLSPSLPQGVDVVDVIRGKSPVDDGPVYYRLQIVSEAGAAADALTELLARDEYTIADPRRNRPVSVRAHLVGGSAFDDHLVVELVAVNGRPPRPAPLVAALCEIAGTQSKEVPRFGVCTKLASHERRHGDQPWLDADAVQAIPKGGASSSSTPASPKRVASRSSRTGNSTSTT